MVTAATTVPEIFRVRTTGPVVITILRVTELKVRSTLRAAFKRLTTGVTVVRLRRTRVRDRTDLARCIFLDRMVLWTNLLPGPLPEACIQLTVDKVIEVTVEGPSLYTPCVLLKLLPRRPLWIEAIIQCGEVIPL